MAKLTFKIDEETENAFRRAVRTYVGTKKGDIKKAATEALTQWITDKKISKHQLELLRKGQYTLPKGWTFNREEIYDERMKDILKNRGK